MEMSHSLDGSVEGFWSKVSGTLGTSFTLCQMPARSGQMPAFCLVFIATTNDTINTTTTSIPIVPATRIHVLPDVWLSLIDSGVSNGFKAAATSARTRRAGALLAILYCQGRARVL